KASLLTGAGVLALFSTTSGAWAVCGVPAQVGITLGNQGALAVPPSASAAAISSAIGNVNTAFLSQQGSAFVSAPGNPQPDQPGGGVWGRAIGGEVTVKSTSISNSSNTQLQASGAGPAGTVVNTSTTACASSTTESFAGVQVGTDIARLNWN